MDIPSIKLRYFEKLKLWHDYLSPDSVYETQKKGYWDHEKFILLWAYTGLHGHLYTGLSNRRLLGIYNLDHGGKDIKTGNEKQKCELEEFKRRVSKDYREETERLREDMVKNRIGTGKINCVMGNLVIKGFMNETEKSRLDSKGYPTEVQINAEGLLLGEVLFENICRPNAFRNNYLKYRVGYYGLILLIGGAILIFISLFFKSVIIPILYFIVSIVLLLLK